MSRASYSPLRNLAAADPPPVNLSIEDLCRNAARAKYGHGIEVLKTPACIKELYGLQLDICIISADPQPVEVKKVVVDVSTKECVNHCQKESDKTIMKVEKANSRLPISGYHFSITRGANCGIGGEIGPQVRSLVITGGTARIHIAGNNTKTGLDIAFNYSNEEVITVPPKSRVRAKVVPHLVTYNQGYVIKFMIPSSVSIPVHYKTRFQVTFGDYCCCPPCNYETGSITAAELFRSLPDYHEENGVVSFIQHGILSWMGEGSTVEKEVEPLD